MTVAFEDDNIANNEPMANVNVNVDADADVDANADAIDNSAADAKSDETPPTAPGRRIGSIYRSTDKGIRIAPSDHGNGADDPAAVASDGEEDSAASWREVLKACCCHSISEWLGIGFVLGVVLFFLYFFLVGLDMLSTSFQVVSGCTAGSMLGSDTNPLASVLIGIVATALLQSSSTTTSIVVSMVGGGLDVQQGIYIVMGANVGTSVTSMFVSLAHMGDGEELERAFAGSSIYYLFNILTCIILLPIEVTTHYLYELTKAMLPQSVAKGDSWQSPIKAIVSPLTKVIIIANKQLIKDVSTGDIEDCASNYPVSCVGGVESYDTCEAGLIGCDKSNNRCPAFFQDGATEQDDIVAGWVCLILAIVLLCVCLIGLVAVLRKLLLGASQRIIYKATNINGVLAIFIGIGVTILVQSSSVTTSTLVPLAGVGVLKLEQMYPLVLGADIGTTFTALMAALVSSKIQSLQIALAHLFFNLTGLVIWYPLPFMRRILIHLSQKLGKITRHWRGFPIIFIIVVFFLIPLLLFGISTCFEKNSTGFVALGVFVVLIIVGGILYFWIWWRFKGGKIKCNKCITRRQRRSAATKTLADDMDYMKADVEYCKNEIVRLKEVSNIPGVVRMEEGRPVITFYPQYRAEADAAAAAAAEVMDEAVSLYESCHSLGWKDILVSAAGDIGDDIGSTIGSAQDNLGGSLRTRRIRLANLNASGRSSRRGGILNRSGRSSRRGGGGGPASVPEEEGSKN